MLLILGTSLGSSRRTVSTRDEKVLKTQRSSFSSGTVLTTSILPLPVRTRFFNPVLELGTQERPLLPHEPEPPDLISLEKATASSTAGSPDPPDPPLVTSTTIPVTAASSATSVTAAPLLLVATFKHVYSTLNIILWIVVRLPATSLMRFKCVSKLWSCLICSRYFSNLYLTVASSPSSPLRPLGLYMSLNYATHDDCKSMEVCKTPGKSELVSLTLSSSSSNSAESSSLKPDLTFPGMGGYLTVSLRGLFLYVVCRKTCIYNPATRQSITLPAVIFAQQKPKKSVNYFFGHDPVHDQYKIVCSAVIDGEKITSEYWVFVLEPRGFWKRIEYDDQQPHFPRRQGPCIKGVIYYTAATLTCRRKFYCFDVRSEKFSKIQAPHEVSQFGKSVGFINHGGKPALFHYTHIGRTGESELWLLEDGGEWSRKSLVLKPCHRHLVDGRNFMKLIVHGTAQNNEVILALPSPRYLLYYDLINNDLRKVNINIETTQDQWPDVCVTVMDKCESIMHLET
ncbi:hypothetical protein Bca101_021505 [Brassica carinata]